MDPKIIQAILHFMQRVQLQGGEASAFVSCINALQQLDRDQKECGKTLTGGMRGSPEKDAA